VAESFGARLRYERERRQIALRSIAESTKISVPLLEGLERDDVSRWPSGIFRKSFVRSYAEAVGLDADAIVREFTERYPDPLEVVSAAPINPSGTSSAGPLSIKLTITWSGSVRQTIGRLVDWQIRRLRNLPIFQSANLPMVHSANPRECGAEARGPAPPA
jgi:cytoskeletal protein RodZ